jgi:hypothetical protein
MEAQGKEMDGKEFLEDQLAKTREEIRNLKIIGVVIVVLGLTISCFTLMHASQTGHITAASAAPIFAALFLVRLVTAPLNRKKELAWGLDNKLTMMESSSDDII